MGKAKLARALWRVWHAWGKSWQHGDHADRLRGRDRREWRAAFVSQRWWWIDEQSRLEQIARDMGIDDAA